jgi:hypothetical protein
MRLVESEVSYRASRFFEDNDRRRASTQHLLYLDLIADRWSFRHRTCDLGLSVRHDLGQGKTSAQVIVSWYLNPGRGYRDMHPSQRDFLGLHKQRSPGGLVPFSYLR